MTLIDRNFRYSAANNSYCANFNKPRDEIVGRTVEEVWDQDIFQHTIKPYLDRCFMGETVEYEEWFKFGESEKRCFHVTYSPFNNSNGQTTHAVVVSHDITKRKQAQEEIWLKNMIAEVYGVSQSMPLNKKVTFAIPKS